MADLFSFSRLNSFMDCPRNYYWTYIKHQRGGESIYTYLGTKAHDLAEAIESGEKDSATAVQEFLEAVDEADMLGLTWITDKSKLTYVDCVVHFLQNHEKSKDPNLKIEDVFAVQIEGIVIYGYIDKWYRDEKTKTITIVDYKTSSKFSAADIEHKVLQLYIYAEALQKYYPEYTIQIQFNMMKYVNTGRALKLRNELSISSKYTDGIVPFVYTEECHKTLVAFINEVLTGIRERNESDIEAWEMKRNPEKDFFCKTLCNNCEKCRGQ